MRTTPADEPQGYLHKWAVNEKTRQGGGFSQNLQANAGFTAGWFARLPRVMLAPQRTLHGAEGTVDEDLSLRLFLWLCKILLALQCGGSGINKVAVTIMKIWFPWRQIPYLQSIVTPLPTRLKLHPMGNAQVTKCCSKSLKLLLVDCHFISPSVIYPCLCSSARAV
jgi:hypothetical protein